MQRRRMMAKMGLEFDGMAQLMAKLDRMGASADKAAERALEKTHEVVTERVDAAQGSSRYNVVPGVAGATSGSVHRRPDVEWSGALASVGVGWSIGSGGLPSVFLMYGTPSIAPDRGLYDAVFGAKTRAAVKGAQAETLSLLVAEGGAR